MPQTEGLIVKFSGDVSELQAASKRAVTEVIRLSKMTDSAANDIMKSWQKFSGLDTTKGIAEQGAAIQAVAGQWKIYQAEGEKANSILLADLKKTADAVQNIKGQFSGVGNAVLIKVGAQSDASLTQVTGTIQGLQAAVASLGGGTRAFDEIGNSIKSLYNVAAPVKQTVEEIGRALGSKLVGDTQKGTLAITTFEGAAKRFSEISTAPLTGLSQQAEQLGTALNTSALSIVRFSDATGDNTSSAAVFHKTLQQLYDDLARYEKALNTAGSTDAFRSAAKGIGETSAAIAKLEKDAAQMAKNFAIGMGAIPPAVRKTFKSIGDLEQQLSRFKEGVKNATSIDAIARYNRAIEATEKRIKALSGIRDPFQAVSTGIGKVAQSGDQATQALINVSRVAQDAPYGFMGIANNLNPLLESFQRLQQSSGGTKAALASLGGALIGPAGIGLALGVVSSLIVTFGDKLFDSGKAIDANTTQLLAFARAAQDSADRVEALEGKISQLNKLAKINLQIQFDDPNKVQLFDLKGQSVQNKEFIANLESEIEGLKAKSAQAFNFFMTKGSDKAVQAYHNGLLEGIISDLDEKDKKLVEGFQNIDKTIADQEQKLTNARNNQTSIYREIALSKVEAAREAAKKAESEAKKIKPEFDFFDKWFQFNPNKKNLTNKQFDELLDAARSFAKEYGQAFEGLDFNLPTESAALEAARKWWDDYRKGIIKLKVAKVPIDVTFVPEITVEKGNEDALLNSIQALHDRATGIMKGTIVINQFELDTQKVEIDFRKKFANWGKDLPKVDLSKTLSTQELTQFYQDNLDQLDATANLINQTLTPAMTDFFATLQSGGDAFHALFAGLKQQVAQLITRLAAAAAVSAVIAAVTGGGSMAGFGKIFTSLSGLPKFASGGIISGPTLGIMGEYAGAKNNPEVIAPLDKLKGLLAGASGGGNVTVTGKISGSDILLSNARTSRKQRRGG